MASPEVLVIEDSDVEALILQAVLEKLQVKMVRCRNAEDALKILLENRKFKLLLVDVSLPGMSGFDFAQRVKARQLHAALIFITGQATQNDVLNGVLVGAKDYIRKPFNVADVEARIKAHL